MNRKSYLIAFAVLVLVALGLAGGTPQSFILQLQNAGSTIATFANYGVLNCSTGMSCTKNGSTVTMIAGSPTMVTPGYFFPDNFLFEVWDPTNIDPRGGGTLSLCASWKSFYLPFATTITRYRFQTDGVGTATGVFVYAGLYDSTGALLFDIGKIAITTAGQYGPGAAHDTGTVFFDASRNATSSVTLAPGWYYYGWGAEVATGTGLVFPQMGSTSVLWDEQINIDTVGISPVLRRWGHSGGFDITAGHMPTVLGRTYGGVATEPMNITFFN